MKKTKLNDVFRHNKRASLRELPLDKLEKLGEMIAELKNDNPSEL